MSDPINQLIESHDNDVPLAVALREMARNTDNMAEFTRIVFRVNNWRRQSEQS